jgi:hypothetical protein
MSFCLKRVARLGSVCSHSACLFRILTHSPNISHARIGSTQVAPFAVPGENLLTLEAYLAHPAWPTPEQASGEACGL